MGFEANIATPSDFPDTGISTFVYDEAGNLGVTLPTKLMLISLIPVSHILYFGGDPSKPGLENMLGVVEYVFLSAGIGVAWLIRMYVSVARPR